MELPVDAISFENEYFRVTSHGADGLIVPMPATNHSFFSGIFGRSQVCSKGINLSKTGLHLLQRSKGGVINRPLLRGQANKGMPSHAALNLER